VSSSIGPTAREPWYGKQMPNDLVVIVAGYAVHRDITDSTIPYGKLLINRGHGWEELAVELAGPLMTGPGDAPLRLTAAGPGSRAEIAEYIRETIERRTTPNEDTSAERLALGITTAVLYRLGAGYSVATGGLGEVSSSDECPVWELQPSDPALAQCGECFALVLRAAMKAHEDWHSRLTDDINGCER
jgi:hypothetical protein